MRIQKAVAAIIVMLATIICYWVGDYVLSFTPNFIEGAFVGFLTILFFLVVCVGVFGLPYLFYLNLLDWTKKYI